jgi:pimeloyl-ACP methyl ester carboxylesterase
MKRALLTVAALGAVLAASAGAGSDRTAYSCAAGPDVSFRAADGTKLVGHRFGSGSTAVVLGHQSQGTLCEWAPYARRLAARGYFVFAFDFRGHGRSQARTGAAANRLALDVAAAVRNVRAFGKRKVFVVGASMGGIATLVAGASVQPPVAGVVAVSAPARFLGLDAVVSAPRLRAPVLYLAAAGDDNAGYDFSEDAQAMYARTASRDKRVAILPGNLHGVALVGGSARARSLLEGFLSSR